MQTDNIERSKYSISMENSMRQENSSSNASGGRTPTSWLGWKEMGQVAFERRDYREAIECYEAALVPILYCPNVERQFILSNIVAARLKIGGRAHLEAALKAAQECVSIRDNWAKAHVRLASVYVAMGGHSNAACNSLQRALQLDPGNPAARDMLVRELRRDNSNNSSTGTPSHPAPSAPPEEYQYADREYPATSDRPDSARSARNAAPMADTITWQERMQFYYHRTKMWYYSQSDDVRTILMVLVGVIVLYVAFGGRFGLGSRGVHQHGNYESGNVYDQYYGRDTTASSSPMNRRYDSSSYDRRASYGRHSHDRHSHRHYHYSARHHGSPWGLSNLFDGSVPSMMILAGVAYMCHRNGINPLQAIMLMNAIGGGGRRRRRFRGWY